MADLAISRSSVHPLGHRFDLPSVHQPISPAHLAGDPLSFRASIRPLTRPPAYPSIHLSARLFDRPSAHPPVRVSVRSSTRKPSTNPWRPRQINLRLCVRPSAKLTAYPPGIRPSVYPSAHRPIRSSSRTCCAAFAASAACSA